MYFPESILRPRCNAVREDDFKNNKNGCFYLNKLLHAVNSNK